MTYDMYAEHNRYLQFLQTIPDTPMFTLGSDGLPVEWMRVSGASILPYVILKEDGLRLQVERVSGEILYWGRVTAAQRLVLSIRERHLRSWKADFELKFRAAAKPGPKDAHHKQFTPDGHKITEGLIESHYRVDPAYEQLNRWVDQARESLDVAEVIHTAFSKKAELLKADVRRLADGSLGRLSV
jgi:hypothetical protein